ncbi:MULTISPECIES: hypothetical protein [unclassified Pseudoalteromonas]|jgi:hypothetical protein|uniref:hypothetical protein n=1 Tax=unclassified Pseudoalteromonas TaxID=194690 RepID=UPI000976C6D6|nr:MULTISPECIES: hypothetical protein [unclassified Pseudoalteromonas]MDN3490209.1 hypothetical protein [Pseudoalteromonas sp. APC 3694]|tara:strand:+ start:3008 stop:3826 length:819 start_codon:yes stop_codon:yes gene_type:complete
MLKNFIIFFHVVFFSACSSISIYTLEKGSVGNAVIKEHDNVEIQSYFSNGEPAILNRNFELNSGDYEKFPFITEDLSGYIYVSKKTMSCLGDNFEFLSYIEKSTSKIKIFSRKERINVRIVFLLSDKFNISEKYINNSAYLYFKDDLCEISYEELETRVYEVFQKTYHELTHVLQPFEEDPLISEIQASTVSLCYVLTSDGVSAYELSKNAVSEDFKIPLIPKGVDLNYLSAFYSDYGNLIAQNNFYKLFRERVVIISHNKDKINEICNNYY